MSNSFLSAISKMSGDSVSVVSISGLSKHSTDIEILDYVMAQLCACLDTSKMALKVDMFSTRL